MNGLATYLVEKKYCMTYGCLFSFSNDSTCGTLIPNRM